MSTNEQIINEIHEFILEGKEQMTTFFTSRIKNQKQLKKLLLARNDLGNTLLLEVLGKRFILEAALTLPSNLKALIPRGLSNTAPTAIPSASTIPSISTRSTIPSIPSASIPTESLPKTASTTGSLPKTASTTGSLPKTASTTGSPPKTAKQIDIHVSELLDLLLNYSGGISINTQDSESGYTPLHKCLLRGKLRWALLLLKNSNIDFKLTDHEGFTVFDLLNASIKLPKIKSNGWNTANYDLSSSNTNITTNPSEEEDCTTHESSSMLDQSTDNIVEELLQIDQLSISENSKISFQSFQEPSSSMSLWSWGSNSNYLLGHGMADSRTFPELIKLPSLSHFKNVEFQDLIAQDPHIIQLCMSKYHAALITKESIYTYGFGQGGRLGHGTEETKMTPYPLQSLQKVTFAALGTDHSLAITKDGLVFTWGSNEHSQLGHSPNAKKVLVPTLVACLKRAKCVGAACGKYHSVVFTDAGEVYTWGKNNGQLGHNASMKSVQVPKKVISFPTTNILQSAATSNATLILTSQNQVYVFISHDITRLLFATESVYVRPNSFQPSSSTSNTHIPCKLSACESEYDVGIVMMNGNVCLWSSFIPPDLDTNDSSNQCTISFKPRIVWKAKRKQKRIVDCALGLNHSLLVVTESGHVYTGTKKSGSSTPQSCTFSSIPTSSSTTNEGYKFNQVQNLEHVVRVVSSSSGSFAAIRSDYRYPFPDTTTDIDTTSLWQDYKDVAGQARTDYDFWIQCGDYVGGCHKLFLCSTSSYFRSLLLDQNPTTPFQNSLVQYNKDENVVQIVKNVSNPAVAIDAVLKGIYTGKYNLPSDASPALNDDFRWLIKVFHLDTSRSSHRDLQTTLLKYSGIFPSVLVHVKGDEMVKVDSVIVSCRCPYFRILVGCSSPWTLAASEKENMPIINLTHVPGKVFKIILQWLITNDPLLFDLDHSEQSLEEWLSFLKHILQVSNELLLPGLVSICSVYLARFITINNVLELLQHGMTFNAPSLKESCLDFVVRNIETFLKRSYLQNAPVDVVVAVEEKISSLQVAKLPYMLGPNGFYHKLSQLNQDVGSVVHVKKARGIDSVPLLEVDQSSPLLSPVFSRDQSSSTLINAGLSPSFSPLMLPKSGPSGNGNELGSSMDEFSLDSSSWTESRSKRKSSLLKSSVSADSSRNATPRVSTLSSPKNSYNVSSSVDSNNGGSSTPLYENSPFWTSPNPNTNKSFKSPPFSETYQKQQQTLGSVSSKSFLGHGLKMVKQMKSSDSTITSPPPPCINSSYSPMLRATTVSSSTLHQSQLSARLSAPSPSSPSAAQSPRSDRVLDNGIQIKSATKMSQKERKRLNSIPTTPTKNSNVQNGSNGNVGKTTPSKGWNIPSRSLDCASTPDFSSIIKDQQVIEGERSKSSQSNSFSKPFSSVKKKDGWVPFSLNSTPTKPSFKGWDSPSKTEPSLSLPMDQTSTSKKPSLLDIQKEQIMDNKVEKKIKSKTLAQIQAEETAIQEIMEFYKSALRGAGQDSGEWISLEMKSVVR